MQAQRVLRDNDLNSQGGCHARDPFCHGRIEQARKPNAGVRQTHVLLRRVRALGAMRPAPQRQLHHQGGANGKRWRQAQPTRAVVAGQPGRIIGMDPETVARIFAFLDAHHVMALATCGEGGPHAANVLYVREGFALVWVSHPTSRHSREVASDARVAATIAPDYVDIDAIRGVQISGLRPRLERRIPSCTGTTAAGSPLPRLETALPRPLAAGLCRYGALST